MFNVRCRIARLNIWKRVRAAFIADEQTVTLREVARAVRAFQNADQTAIRVVGNARRNAFRDNRRTRVFADVNHLGAGIGLLMIVGDGHRVKLADAIVALQNNAWIFPGNRAAGFDLRPRNLGAMSGFAALGDEVVNAADAIFIARIPVLHSGILHRCVVHRHDFHDCRVQLIGVETRRRTAFQVRNVRALIGDNQGALELSAVLGVDAKIGRQFHWAAHAFGNVAKRAVRENRAVQSREKVIGMRHDAPQILLHQLGMFAHGVAKRAEDDTQTCQMFLERGRDGNAIENRIDCDLRHRVFFRVLDAFNSRGRDAGFFIDDVRQTLLLLNRDAQLVERFQQLRIDFIQTIQARLFFGRRVINDVLVVDERIFRVEPVRFGQRLPVTKRFQAPVEQPLRLVFFGGNLTNNVFGQASRESLGFDVGLKTVFVFLSRQIFDLVSFGTHLAPPQIQF